MSAGEPEIVENSEGAGDYAFRRGDEHKDRRASGRYDGRDVKPSLTPNIPSTLRSDSSAAVSMTNWCLRISNAFRSHWLL